MLAKKHACLLTVSYRTVADTGNKVLVFQQLVDSPDTRIPPSSCSSPQLLQHSPHETSYYSAHSPRKICKGLFESVKFVKGKNCETQQAVFLQIQQEQENSRTGCSPKLGSMGKGGGGLCLALGSNTHLVLS